MKYIGCDVHNQISVILMFVVFNSPNCKVSCLDNNTVLQSGVPEVTKLITSIFEEGSGELSSESSDHTNHGSPSTVDVLHAGTTTSENSNYQSHISTFASSSSSDSPLGVTTSIGETTDYNSTLTSTTQLAIAENGVETNLTEMDLYTEVPTTNETTTEHMKQDEMMSTMEDKSTSTMTSELEITTSSQTATPTSLSALDIPVPQDLKVTNQSTTSLVLSWSWSNNSIRVDNFVVMAFGTDGVVVSSATINITSDELYSYIVQGLSAGMCYNVSVSAALDDMQGPSGYPLQDVCTVPGIPYDISVSDKTNNSVIVEWKWSDDLGGVDSFVVMATDGFNTVTGNINSTGDNRNEYSIDGLLYGTCYKISVRAVFKGLYGFNEFIPDLLCTLPSAPQHVLVSEDSLTTNSFIVQWQWTEENGGIDNFLIIVSSDTDGLVIMESVNDTSEFYIVTNMTAGTCYDVYMAAKFNGSTGSLRHARTCTLPATPENIIVTSQTSSSINVSWTQLGGADSFIVEVTDTVMMSVKNYSTVSRWHNIDQLPPGSCYGISVRAEFNGKSGVVGNLTNTACTVPLQPLNVAVTNVTTTELTIIWEWSSDRGGVDEFIISAEPTRSSDFDTARTEISTFGGHEFLYSHVLGSLTPGQCYNISVTSVINELRGEPFRLATCQFTWPATPEILPEITYVNTTLTIYLKSVAGFVDSYSINSTCDPVDPSNVIQQNNSITLFDVQPWSVCTVVIYAVTGEMTSQPAVVTFVTSETEPGPVVNLRSTNISTNSIFVQWNSPDNPNGNITQYHINVSSSLSEDSVSYVEPASSDKYVYNYNLPNLSPGTGYIITVSAENGAGLGTESAISVYTKETDESKLVSGPVSNLSLVSVSNSNLTIQWSPPVTPNGNITAYFLHLVSQSELLNETIKATEEIVYDYTFQHLTSGTCYSVIVTAINSAGVGDQSNITVYTNETAPGIVSDVVTRNLSSSVVFIEWGKPIDPNGVVYMYSLTVRRNTSDNCEQLITLTCVDCTSNCYTDQDNKRLQNTFLPSLLCPDSQDIMMTKVNYTEDKSKMINVYLMNLVPATDYVVTIYGHTEAGIGPGYVLYYTTFEDRPSTAVRGVKVLWSNSSSVTLSFLPPEQPNGQITSYTIQYFYKQYVCIVDIESADIVTMTTKIYPDKETIPVITTIINLESFWAYTFSIVAATDVGEGFVWSDNITHTTNQSVPGDIEISNITFPDITPYSIVISWDPPCYPNGVIMHYLIQMKEVADHDTDTRQISTIDNITSYKIENLVPDTFFEFQIAAVNRAGQGNFTTFKSVKTYTDGYGMDLQEFLRKRGVEKCQLDKLLDDKIDIDAIKLMTDDEIAVYLPAKGDRLAIRALYGTYQAEVKKQKLFHTLRSKMKLRNRKYNNSGGDNSDSEREFTSLRSHLKGNKNASKKSRKLELGWIHDGRQVRKRNGGGTRNLVVDKTTTKKDMLDLCKNLFFPEGKSKSLELKDVECDILDFKETPFPDGVTIADIYEEVKMGIVRFYLSTKTLIVPISNDTDNFSDSLPDPEETTVNSPSVSYSLTNSQPGHSSPLHENVFLNNSPKDESISLSFYQSSCGPEVDNSTPLSSIIMTSDNSQTNIGPLPLPISIPVRYIETYDLNSPSATANGSLSLNIPSQQSMAVTSVQTASHSESGTSNEFGSLVSNPAMYGTLIDDEPQADILNERSSPSDTVKHIITIHRVNILEEMVSHFKTRGILDSDLSFTFVGEAGHDQSGVSRDAYTAFWDEFFIGDAEGEESRVPAIKWQEEEWMSVGRILLKGFTDHAVFPLKLNLAFFVALVHGEEYVDSEMLLESFMSYICHSDGEIVKLAVEGNLDTSFNEDIIDFLDRYGCKKIPVRDEMKPQIIQIAHKQLIQKPKYALDKMKNVAQRGLQILFPTIENIKEMFQAKKPSVKRVLNLLTATPSTVDESTALKYLQQFIRAQDDNTLKRLLRFFTGADTMSVDKIDVIFTSMNGFGRRIIAHTCGPTIELPSTYQSYPEFRKEIECQLSSPECFTMDIA